MSIKECVYSVIMKFTNAFSANNMMLLIIKKMRNFKSVELVIISIIKNVLLKVYH